MTRIGKTLSLVAALALWQGCSSTSDSGDGSASDAAIDVVATSDGPVLGLSRGANSYKVTSVSGVTDGCMILPAEFLNAVVPVTFVEATQILSIGNPQGDPVQPSLGSGVVGTMGTVTRDNDTVDSTSTCSWHQKDVGLFTLTGVDVFTLDVTETESAFVAACGTTAPASGTCVSTFNLTFAITTTPDGGSN